MAIVGCRSASPYGRPITERIGRELVRRGITIVSGMARGIDSIGHLAALKEKGRTLAVFGSGLDVLYPPENRKLAGQIRSSGAIISEFFLGTKPEAPNFPRRNRLTELRCVTQGLRSSVSRGGVTEAVKRVRL